MLVYQHVTSKARKPPAKMLEEITGTLSVRPAAVFQLRHHCFYRDGTEMNNFGIDELITDMDEQL